jgi:FKBP-type peptidyl-prolyl cis-trans isomerase 2
MNRKQYKDMKIERGETFVSQSEPVQILLGDPKVNHGFWRAIEHMRKGEKALVMVKPAWGYAMPDFSDQVEFPKGWESGEKRE